MNLTETVLERINNRKFYVEVSTPDEFFGVHLNISFLHDKEKDTWLVVHFHLDHSFFVAEQPTYWKKIWITRQDPYLTKDEFFNACMEHDIPDIVLEENALKIRNAMLEKISEIKPQLRYDIRITL